MRIRTRTRTENDPDGGGRPSRPRARRRGLLVTAALVGLLAVLGASCKQLDPANRAANVPGVTNGNLPISYLGSTADGCVVYDEALASMKAMIAQAAVDGVKLRGIGCYRDYAGQVAVRNDWCSRGQCAMAAVPGTSNHGWGKAVDWADQKGELTFDSAGYAWLKQWAGHYGWIHPASMEPDGPIPEPWHWEWIGDGGKMFLGQYFGIGNAPLAEPRGLPFGALDEVQVGVGTLSARGWAIDPDQSASIPVHVYVDGVAVEVMANKPRPDVAAAYPLYAASPHGYVADFVAAPGSHEVCVYAINVSGTGFNRLLRCVTVTVPGTMPSTPSAVAAPSPSGPVAQTSPPTTTAPAPTTTAPVPATAPAPTTVPAPTSTSTTSTTAPAQAVGA